MPTERSPEQEAQRQSGTGQPSGPAIPSSSTPSLSSIGSRLYGRLGSRERTGDQGTTLGATREVEPMAWSWRLEKSDGQTVGVAEETFSTQADAETWLGEHWRTLREDGIDQVTLLDGTSVSYGPMSLGDAT
jgi:hypothetical protein